MQVCAGSCQVVSVLKSLKSPNFEPFLSISVYESLTEFHEHLFGVAPSPEVQNTYFEPISAT